MKVFPLGVLRKLSPPHLKRQIFQRLCGPYEAEKFNCLQVHCIVSSFVNSIVITFIVVHSTAVILHESNFTRYAFPYSTGL
jgi:hypothetical protein